MIWNLYGNFNVICFESKDKPNQARSHIHKLCLSTCLRWNHLLKLCSPFTIQLLTAFTRKIPPASFLTFYDKYLAGRKKIIILFVHQKALKRLFHCSFFYYKITFLNSKHKNTNLKSNIYLKPGLKCEFERFLSYKNINLVCYFNV